MIHRLLALIMAYNFDYLSGYSPGGSLVDYSAGLSTKVNGFNGVSSKSSNSSNMWGAIASAAGGVVSSLINGNSAKKQFKYQQKLNAQQQEYARENATTAYNRQRDLTSDNPLLQKQGMRNAGMSTAFSDGSSVGAASSVDQAAAPNAGTAPEIPQVGSLFGQGVQAVASVADLAMKRAQIAKIKSDVANTNADTQGKTIDNLTKADQNVANLENTKADTKGKAAKTHLDETQGKILDVTGMGTAIANQNLAESNAAIAAADASVRVDQNRLGLAQQIASIENTLANTNLSKEQRKNLEEVRKNLIKQRDVMDSQINANNASAYASYASGADSYSHVAVNKATVEQIQQNTRLTRYQADYFKKSAGWSLKKLQSEYYQNIKNMSFTDLKMKSQELVNASVDMKTRLNREANQALDRIKAGKGSKYDYAVLAAAVTREGAQDTLDNGCKVANAVSNFIPGAGSASTVPSSSPYGRPTMSYNVSQ